MTVIRQVIPTEVIYDRSQADVTAVALYQMHIDTTMTERKLVSYSGEPLKIVLMYSDKWLCYENRKISVTNRKYFGDI